MIRKINNDIGKLLIQKAKLTKKGVIVKVKSQILRVTGMHNIV
jgi:hypothetical protein